MGFDLHIPYPYSRRCTTQEAVPHGFPFPSFEVITNLKTTGSGFVFHSHFPKDVLISVMSFLIRIYGY